MENRTKLRVVPKTGKAYIVGAGPGDPELLTFKAARVLSEAEVVLYDRLVNPAIMDHIRYGARRIYVGKRPGHPSMSQHDINRLIVEHVLEGSIVVRLKGGDPFIFGRGGEECLELAGLNLPFEVIPGISSALAVPAYAGIPLTQRNEATGFTVISGHLHPDSNPYEWDVLAKTSTLVILMGLKNLGSIMDGLVRNGKPADTPVAIIQWGTTSHQQVTTGTVATIARKAQGIAPPAIVVCGEVVKYHERLNWFVPSAMHFETGQESPLLANAVY